MISCEHSKLSIRFILQQELRETLLYNLGIFIEIEIVWFRKVYSWRFQIYFFMIDYNSYFLMYSVALGSMKYFIPVYKRQK